MEAAETSLAEELPAGLTSRGWLAFATGLNLAFAICYLICKPLPPHVPPPHALTPPALNWVVRLRTCSVYLLVACGAGAIGTWIALPRAARPQLRPLLQSGFRGWIFLPAIALFLRMESIGAQMLATLAAVLMALSLYNSGASLGQKNGEAAVSRKNLFAAEIPLSPGSWLPFVLSLLAYGILLSVVADRIVLATALLTAFTFVGVLRFTSDLRSPKRKPQRQPSRLPDVRAYLLCALAFYFILIALSNPSNPAFAHLGLRGAASNSRQAKQPADPHPSSSFGYRSIILWPTEKPEKVILAPPVRTQASTLGLAKPMVIPFFGPYWYFKFPGELPGPNTRTSRGDPLRANVRSTDAYPLLMEARQHLAGPIDLSCCGELQIVFRNDASAGTIAVGITLADSHHPAKLSQDLGIQAVASRPVEQAGSWAREETLTFRLPVHSDTQQFDDINVTLLPDPAHRTSGRRVAVERFILLPR